MKVDRIRLANFKCYGETDLALDDGVTVIHGPNGSGKSSLLEATFFALYGSAALETGMNLADVVTNGANEATVEVWFTHGDADYRVERVLKRTDDSAHTRTCVLDTPADTIEGARDVRSTVESMLRMDADAFVNCAYVRQGEVNKLIHASPRDRQDMIDDLLQLGKLEEYRERASAARLGVRSVSDGYAETRRELDTQIRQKEDKDLPGRLNDLETELVEVSEEIERFEANREEAIETRDEAVEVLEAYEKHRERIDELAAAVEELESTIRDAVTEREELAEEVTEHRSAIEDAEETLDGFLDDAEVDDVEAAPDRRAELADEDDEIQGTIQERSLEVQSATKDATALEETAEGLEETIAEKTDRIADLRSAIEDAEATVADRREKLEALKESIEAATARFDDAPVEFGAAETVRSDLESERETVLEEVTSLRAKRERLVEQIADAEALLEEGKCPECGQDVDGSPHVDGVDEDREALESVTASLESTEEERSNLDERLESATRLVEAEADVETLQNQRSTMRQLVDEKADSVDERREEVERLEAEVAVAREEVEQAREDAAAKRETAQAARQKIASLNERRANVREELARLDEIESVASAIEEHERDIERLEERRAHLAELNDERRSRLKEKRAEKRELKDAYDDEQIASAKDDREDADSYLERVESKLESLRDRRDELQSAIGGVKNEMEELSALRDRRAEIEATLDGLESLYDEVESLESMYGQLRADLRQRNVETLERMLNETFDLIYENDSYARIELDGNYELTVYQKDGEALDPEQLSGGERALFNLSLRCAIYRLLAEGIEGGAPLPPLILDEPTVFLDAGHVSRLVDLVDTMYDLGVEQIVVVSHDDELVGAADDLVTVEKNPTSNRSSVRRGRELPVG